MGGWGLENPYDVRILNALEIIGRSLIMFALFVETMILVPYTTRSDEF